MTMEVRVTAQGFYIMGRYTSCAWFLRREDADAECKRMNYRGGCVYRVEEVK